MAKRKAEYEGIQPDTKNANKGTERGRYMVEASLRETGAGRSIVLDKDGRIIAGNKTFEAASDIGLPVRIVQTDGTELVAVQRTDLDLSDDTGAARKLAYYDNRAGQVGLEWDASVLLGDITAGLDLSAMFRQDELDELLADLTPKTEGDTAPQIDRAEELRQQWQTAPGQLWLLDSGKGHPHKLICGDCTDAATVARVMGGERATAVVTDPPYAVFGSSTGIGKNITDDKMILPFCREVFAAAVSVTETNAHIYIHCDWKSFNAWWSQLERFDLRPLNCIVWDKGDGGIGTNYTSRHEFILFLNREPKQTKMTVGGGGMRQIHGIANVQRFNVPQNEDRLHNAAKPVELESVFIKASTDQGAIVFDPFSGSGTTLIACENLSRKARACEISPGYVAVTLQRFLDHTGVQPVLFES